MSIGRYLEAALRLGASDLHLEPDFPPTFRVRSQLVRSGEPVPGDVLHRSAREVLDDESWRTFEERKSSVLTTAIGPTKVRMSLFWTSGGVGMAIRLLATTEPTVRNLNLHPEVARMVFQPHGLIVVSGPTGSGKSSTVTALLSELTEREARHVITIEQPVEYPIDSHESLLRRRHVGRDTPSFEQALRDALHEDPDVIMVGELNDPETMRLTLAAAETGHLVLTTLHASSIVETLNRLVAAFPATLRDSICNQLAECLIGVINQRLVLKPELGIRVPECEVLVVTDAARAVVRKGDFYKIRSVLQTAGGVGSWTLERYRDWLATKADFVRPAAETRRPSAMAPVRAAPVEDAPSPGADADGAKPTRSAPVIDLDASEESLEEAISRIKR